VPRELRNVGTPSDWLRRAHADLSLAKGGLPAGALYDDLCFHAQQAAEKAVKAVCLSLGRGFRYTHDLAALMDGLRESRVEIPNAVREAEELTKFAWEARYPGPAEPVSNAEYQQAVLLAERVLKWAEPLVK